VGQLRGGHEDFSKKLFTTGVRSFAETRLGLFEGNGFGGRYRLVGSVSTTCIYSDGLFC